VHTSTSVSLAIKKLDCVAYQHATLLHARLMKVESTKMQGLDCLLLCTTSISFTSNKKEKEKYVIIFLFFIFSTS
jgi:hypothetical protein